MPLVKIHLRKGRSPRTVKAIADGVHTAFEETMMQCHKQRIMRYQLISQYTSQTFFFNRTFRGEPRSKDLVFIEIITGTESKRFKALFYMKLVKLLTKTAKIRKGDLFVALVELPMENWWFVGKGQK